MPKHLTTTGIGVTVEPAGGGVQIEMKIANVPV